MKIEDIHVGDVLRIRDVDDMAEEYGMDEFGHIYVPLVFTSGMHYLCGQTFTVYSIKYPKIHSVEGIEGFYDISAEMLEPLCDEPDCAPDFEPVDVSSFLS